jgi:epimerase transport system membrane fusion protein
LIVEAQVSPADIDRIHAGQDAELKFPAFKTRTLPRIDGRVISISADRLSDDKQAEKISYYLARIEVGTEGLQVLSKHELVLVPGMPAEVMIKTGERTMLQYLVRPLRDGFARGMKED